MRTGAADVEGATGAADAGGVRRCVIVGASPDTVLPAGFAELAAGSFLVAADGGYAFCRDAGAAVDLLVADYDSLERGSADEAATEVLELPRAKDDTDLLAACREGLARGCTEFSIYGCLGGDIGHTVAAVQALAFLSKRGARGRLFGTSQLVYLVAPGDGLDLARALDGGGRAAPAQPGTRVGVFSFTPQARGVVERGLAWELEDAVLEAAFPLGASNEVRERGACIGVREGLLLVVAGG